MFSVTAVLTARCLLFARMLHVIDDVCSVGSGSSSKARTRCGQSIRYRVGALR